MTDIAATPPGATPPPRQTAAALQRTVTTENIAEEPLGQQRQGMQRMNRQIGIAAEAAFPRERVAWYVIAVLFLLTLFSQLDRQLPALLVAPIKAEFGISDTAFSMVQGYAFAFVFTLMSLPLGRLVDRTNRRNLLFAGVVLWSVMTIAAGSVTSYSGFFVARMGVGVGEAVLSPAAFSLIADYFRPERRGRAISVFYLAYAMGQGAAFAMGALLLRLVPEGGLELPLIGHYSTWRMAFLVAGTPGLLLALLLLTVREPLRREVAVAQDGGTVVSESAALAYMRANAMAYVALFACPAAMSIVGFTAVNWAPAFYERNFHLPPAQSGSVLGAMMAAAGLAGTLLAGVAGDRLVRGGTRGARLRIAITASVLLIPTSLWPLAPQLWISMAMLGLLMFGLMLGLAAVPAIMQDITPNRMRGQVVAGYSFVGGMIGIALAPTLVALLTDRFFQDEAKVGYSLVIVAFPAAVLGALACWSGLAGYARTYEAVHKAAPRRPGAGAA
jgi:MFS family permease